MGFSEEILKKIEEEKGKKLGFSPFILQRIEEEKGRKLGLHVGNYDPASALSTASSYEVASDIFPTSASSF